MLFASATVCNCLSCLTPERVFVSQWSWESNCVGIATIRLKVGLWSVQILKMQVLTWIYGKGGAHERIRD